MTKRIPCKVVRSVPLDESSNAFQHVSRSNNKHHKAGSTGAVNARVRHTVNSVRDSIRDDPILQYMAKWESETSRMGTRPSTYTNRLGINRLSIDNGPTGRIFDCYA